jgi:hypothetical protein
MRLKLKPETLAAHRERHSKEPKYPPHTLAPDPDEPEFAFTPLKGSHTWRVDNCKRCGVLHLSENDREHCRQANAQREQY